MTIVNDRHVAMIACSAAFGMLSAHGVTAAQVRGMARNLTGIDRANG